MSIRRVRPEDFQSIIEIYNASIGSIDEEGEEWYRSLIEASDSSNLLLVAILDDRPVGFVNLYHRAGKGYLEAIAIHPRYRRMGIGSQLLREAEARLSKRRVEVVKLNVKQGNVRALSFYLRHGYTIDGEKKL